MEKFKKQTSFATILRNKPIDKNLVTIINNAYRKNTNFFKAKPNRFQIIICDTEEEIKKQAKYKYIKWGTAYFFKDRLVSRSPEFVEKIGRWKRKDYQNIITHEMCHIFWRYFANNSRPAWLGEGLACYLGNNFPVSNTRLKGIIDEYNVDHTILHYLYLRRKVPSHLPFYPIWQKFTEYTIKRYGKQKIFALMNLYSKNPLKRRFQISFQKVYGLKEKELFNEFLTDLTC